MNTNDSTSLRSLRSLFVAALVLASGAGCACPTCERVNDEIAPLEACCFACRGGVTCASPAPDDPNRRCVAPEILGRESGRINMGDAVYDGLLVICTRGDVPAPVCPSPAADEPCSPSTVRDACGFEHTCDMSPSEAESAGLECDAYTNRWRVRTPKP